ncbi:MAG: histidinol dehydrogenase [Actinomycetota bacterium]|nr:histidinol dehydrogenase [Actinomycetota bacterium]
MRCETVPLSPGGAPPLVRELRGLVPAPESIADNVAKIVAAVRRGGDAAVLEYTRRFDTGGGPPQPLRVSGPALQHAGETLADDIRDGLQLAIAQVDTVARAGLREERTVSFKAHRVVLREAPLERAAVYVPGGRAPYPSTVVMGVVTAYAAGVREVAVCSPPGPDGEIDQVVLAACRLTGAAPVYRMGGAQAVAALAFGTESVGAVDVIVGPGNLWVQEAKRQVSGQVGIDGFAGPSDLLVIADPDAASEPIALDLLAQAEHGPGTLVLCASSSEALLGEISARLMPAQETGAVCRLVKLAGPDDGLALAQAFAPEHLELIGAQAEALAASVTRAGCLFVGEAAATAFGDYVAGSNHILPTGGAARFASSLSTGHFRRGFSEVRIADGSELARAAAPVARAEGFEHHARSMEARIRQNDRDDANR